ncbi:MAG: hypothetical protein WBO37_10200 [Gammaproteobacteria bacterium]
MPTDGYHKNIAGNGTTDTPAVPPRATGGKTVGEIIAAGEKLTGETVVLRAMVMKVNRNILGKNWITLQDGTGTPPDDKLTVTTAETISAGAQVTDEGIVRTNVDLGSGYLYKVLLEDANFTH